MIAPVKESFKVDSDILHSYYIEGIARGDVLFPKYLFIKGGRPDEDAAPLT